MCIFLLSVVFLFGKFGGEQIGFINSKGNEKEMSRNTDERKERGQRDGGAERGAKRRKCIKRGRGRSGEGKESKETKDRQKKIKSQ